MEFDPTVARFKSLSLSGQKTPSVPDTQVEYHTPRLPCLHEVKYVFDLLEDRDEDRLGFRSACEQACELGWTFCTATKRSLRGQMLERQQESPVFSWFAGPSTLRAFLDGRSLAVQGK